MPAIEKATKKYDLDEYYAKALGLIMSGRARNAFDLGQESAAMRERYGKNTFGQSCLLARRLIEAGTRVPTLRTFLCAGAPIPGALVERARAALA